MKSPRDRIILIICAIALVLLFAFHFWLNLDQSQCFINSDMSSELLLSKLLSQDNAILSKQWYYSTELRLINTQLVSGLLFKFTDDWSLVRALTGLFMSLFLLLSYFFFLRQLDIQPKWIMLSFILLLLPISNDLMVHFVPFYVTHVCIMFVFLALFIKMSKTTKPSARYVIAGILLVLSLILGLSGIRYLMILLGPLALSVLISVYADNKEALFGSQPPHLFKSLLTKPSSINLYIIAGCLGFACLGYLVNSKVLDTVYLFASYNQTAMIDIGQTSLFSQLSLTINALLHLCGYHLGVNLLSLSGIANVLVVILIITVFVLLVQYIKSKTNGSARLFQYLVVASILTHLFIFLFTNMLYTVGYSRLLIPVAVLFIPVYACYMNAAKNRFIKAAATIILLIPMVLGSYYTVTDVTGNKAEETRVATVNFLTENGYDFGYATFWNANVLTELSDGQVEVGNLQEDNFASPFLWLTHKKYYREGYHEGKCFLLTTVGELAAAENGNEGNLSIIRQGTEVYNDGQYIIYDYPDTHLFPKIDSAG